ncbi:MAG: hypothetical protein ACT4PU_04525 [Planctomycetota bacterium]
MSLAASPILRLLWRPATLWNVFVLGAGAVFVARVSYVFHGGVDHTVGVEPEVVAASRALLGALGAVALPLTVSCLVAWAVFQWLLCPLTCSLPTLKLRLRLWLTVLALVLSAAVSMLSWQLHAGVSPLHLGTLALLAFGFGVWALDPLAGERSPAAWLRFLALIGAIAAAPELASALAQAPIWTLPFAGGLGLVLLLQPFTAPPLRRRALLPESALGQSYRSEEWTGGPMGQTTWVKDESRIFPQSGRLVSDADLVAAVQHEHFGQSRVGRWRSLLVNSVIWLLVLTAVVTWSEQEQTSSALNPLAALQATLIGPPANERGSDADIHLPLMLAIWCAIFLFGTPIDFTSRFLVPLSRARRVRVAWRASLTIVLELLVAVAVVLSLALAVTSLWLDRSATAPAGPELLRVLLCILSLAPFAQWVRLRFLDSQAGRISPARVGLAMGFSSLVLCPGTTLLILLWRETGASLPIGVQFLAIALLVALSQGLWRAVLARHFARRDLLA